MKRDDLYYKEKKIYDEGFQKGKLQAKEEELKFLEDLDLRIPINTERTYILQGKKKERIKQLQKEIVEEKGK